MLFSFTKHNHPIFPEWEATLCFFCRSLVSVQISSAALQLHRKHGQLHSVLAGAGVRGSVPCLCCGGWVSTPPPSKGGHLCRQPGDPFEWSLKEGEGRVACESSWPVSRHRQSGGTAAAAAMPSMSLHIPTPRLHRGTFRAVPVVAQRRGGALRLMADGAWWCKVVSPSGGAPCWGA